VALTVAYLARGRLHVRGEGEAARTIESEFAQKVRERALSLGRKHAWKQRGRGAQFAGAMLALAGERDPAAMRIAMTSVARGRRAGELLYVLDTDDVGGVFAVAADGGDEQRLFHGNDQRVKHVNVGVEAIACSVSGGGGTANLAAMRLDGSELIELTEGDSVDLAPSWKPGGERRLVYQSAGVARNAQGFPVGLGPFAIHELDIDSGRITTVAEAPAHDLLGPQLASDGTLYYLRRPYRVPGYRSPGRAAVDFLLIPVRLLWALFQFFNFFSARYTGKTLTAGGPRKEASDLRQLMIWGNLVDAEKAAAEGARRGDGAPALVPPSWELMRQRAGGEAEVLRRAVLSFDLCDDGTLVYADGSKVVHVDSEGKDRRVCSDTAIEHVIVVAR
jgi:hypothetical protein